MKHLFLTLACLLSLIVLAQENFLPNPTFAPETIGQNGVPKGWVSSTPGATLTFKDGTVTLMHKDGKRTVFGCDLKDTTEVDVPYVFSCKVSAPQPTQARLYVESVYKVPNGGNHWVGSGAAPFEVGPEPIVRQFSYLRRAEFIDTYLAIISTEGKPLVISDLLLRKARYRDELGGRWNLEDHIEIVDNGVMVTDGKPAVLTGVPVQPGKT